MVYQWRTYNYSVPAQDVGERIEKLDEIHGEVTPEIVLDDARPQKSLLHPLFEWKDDVAAEKYRLHQAGKIIRELVVVKVKILSTPITTPVRAFATIKSGNEKGSYRPIVKVMSEETTRQQVFENALRELAMFEAKYKGLVDFAELISTYMADHK